MLAYHDHSGPRETRSIIERLEKGESGALISDAGTPLVSDPGYRLVDAALSAGVKVVPVPGPVAAIVALSAAGLPSDRFAFEGFLPAKSGSRCNQLEALKNESRTLIFYEAPHRLLDSLRDMAQVFGGERVAVLARELTKKFETIQRLPLAELCEWVAADPNQQRGECVLLVQGLQRDEDELPQAALHALAVLMEELPLKQAAALASRITGVKKNLLYQRALDLQKNSRE